jgi:Spy/CpxP family protein refolding chaperone
MKKVIISLAAFGVLAAAASTADARPWHHHHFWHHHHWHHHHWH